MYPYLRLAKIIFRASLGRRMDFGDVGAVKMLVWPSDIDLYPEMNNGRHLTLMDLGRFDFAERTGLYRLVRRQGWGFVVAGASLRFRHPLRPFRSFEMRTRALGHDGRWFYFLQETLQRGITCSSVLIRGGIRKTDGLVPATEVLEAMGQSDWSPELPDWVLKWIEADGTRKMGETIEETI